MAEATKLPVKTEERKTPGFATWRPFETLRHEIDRLFEDFDDGMWRSRFGRPMFDLQPFWSRGSTWTAVPAVDIGETDKAYEITAELPGCHPRCDPDSLSRLAFIAQPPLKMKVSAVIVVRNH